MENKLLESEETLLQKKEDQRHKEFTTFLEGNKKRKS